ncbi:MAG: TonB-dependent receptor [Novosphingobium sp. 28-62-57]|uniref:TonB-dependent receptor plug domain-containing protein n=1 Tax=unclassified Novosphingobium TaxID=2644732 RepID=UPI000BD6CBE2|nr:MULTISPECIES: TonB-dependent receptor [unclassified Novosphingobium]OYW50287.1 MAG: TonB-dependent receptor [Novosphingobium sp. 12-62-10]OYZ11609.1 MAG: TonB-dependent receptor [Novosphingobium sp. 28-62-57]OZA35940.1 MAG: TonB-dependent receptor [Novosphingobium sp. 17-62-9]HQS68985.1 TonB-dependent receptor plug domain-containing protein [Novosphingobium sp.]
MTKLSTRTQRAILLCGAALCLATPAFAADEQSVPAVADDMANEQTRTAREIVVQGSIGFRNHSDEAEPKLVYDEEYFRRFEPLTAGDALKRVPSVTFLSDVLESDGARLRGLDPGYTQILINGDRIPGSNVDRSFFLDRIPAELVKQVEIVRSNSARRTGDAVAGTLNIVLRDALSMDGGYLRGGALIFDDGEIKPSGGLYYGGKFGPGRLLAGINVQGRYNPKKKSSRRFGDSPENNPNFATEDFDNREDQTDVRDGTDYAGNLSWAYDDGENKFEIAGNYVRTDRDQIERSFEYNNETAISGPININTSGNLLTDNYNPLFIKQESWAATAKYVKDWDFGKTSVRIGFARFDNEEEEFEHEIDFNRSTPRYTGDQLQTRIRDDEMSAQLEQTFKFSEGMSIAVGGFLQNKDRDTNISEAPRNRFNVSRTTLTRYSQFSNAPQEYAIAFGAVAPINGGLNTIEEDRRDVYALVEGSNGPIKFEAGVRWENTTVRINDQTVAAALAQTNTKFNFLLPSASVKVQLGDGRLTASAARTVRRPRFDYISPALLEAEVGDNDLQGNPNLRPETAWGGDLGYEHRLGRTGVVGVNVFYRKIQNLVELTNTGLEGSESDPPETLAFIYQPRNVGDGNVWGVEFDLSADLNVIGLPNTGVFGNLSLIDSSVRDEFGSRRFNGQSKFVYNFGVIQNLPEAGASFGATYRKQGSAFDRTVGEEVTTTYGADLEIFVEKRFGKSFTIRAVGSNLLNSSKDEVFNKFAAGDDRSTSGNQIARNFDEYELESEEAGPVFQIVARYAF